MLSSARLGTPNSRGRRSTLEMQVLKSWQAQYFVLLGGVCVAGAAFGSCLKGWDVVERAVGDPQFAWQAQHFGDAGVEIVAGAVLRALGRMFVWQGQHLAAV